MFVVQARHTVVVRDAVNNTGLTRRALGRTKRGEGLVEAQRHCRVTKEDVVIDGARARL